MFDLPPEEELSSEVGERRRTWLDSCRDREYAVIGGGVTGLMAGLYLQRHNYSTVVMTEADHLGGRLTWDYGPVPLFAPADESLHDLGFPLESEAPVWIDRNLLLTFLVTSFYDEGGIVLTGGYFNADPVSRDDEFRVEFVLSDVSEVFVVSDVISTLGKFDHEERISESETVLEKLVLNTIRRSDGFVQAGVRALREPERSSTPPLESAQVLSGRKAAELVLDEEF